MRDAEVNSLLLETRQRWRIPNQLRPERPKVALQAAIDLAKEICPDAVFRSITNVYNCMGAVVACRRVWVDPEHAVKILKDDGYRKLGGPDEAERGDVVIYEDDQEPVHIGIVFAKRLVVPGENGDSLIVLSKWGGDGEYFHDLTKVPGYLGRPTQYWTDRRTP